MKLKAKQQAIDPAKWLMVGQKNTHLNPHLVLQKGKIWKMKTQQNVNTCWVFLLTFGPQIAQLTRQAPQAPATSPVTLPAESPDAAAVEKAEAEEAVGSPKTLGAQGFGRSEAVFIKRKGKLTSWTHGVYGIR